MDGKMLVTYKLLCKNDFCLELSLKKLLENEKVSKLIKSEFAKGLRNIELNTKESDTKITIETQKELYQFEVNKDDFADIITLAEEDVKIKKLIKKDYSGIELVNIETID
ncbi:hypothetical protein [Halarcobacter ebronensis]|uniref:Uncharacterized protein n=1 Tax=Halarcobacter ebronensis TaxID=1462615 RepID=A0A4Q1ANK9_9BACT|nr:hypothetical protein [Halarcobacter ebronensis]QKF82526.1 hypothetical protein AEBR_2047 [Halarcobacter ebronensis]RXK07457.1 hypothetical protein CRV07_03070 [Halarcobacter ebronensis]